MDYVATRILPARKPTSNTTASTQATSTVISNVSYLAGVSERIFQNEHEPQKMEIYAVLELNQATKLIRSLCMIRTAIIRNYERLNRSSDNRIHAASLPLYIPQEALQFLERKKICLETKDITIDEYLIAVNEQICENIDKCKNIFPDWAEWSYLREMFIMPKGTNPAGIQNAAAIYASRGHSYPYQVYINWPRKEERNLFYNDRVFLRALYDVHGDTFTATKLVSETKTVKDQIYEFLSESEKTAILVDSENCDPYQFYSFLRCMSNEKLLSKIYRVILFDDVHTSSSWSLLPSLFPDLDIKHIVVDRVTERKSLVDISLVAGYFKEYYENHCHSFVLASSDSDFWGLISSAPESKFYVLVDKSKVSDALKQKLQSNGYPYTYINNFGGDCSSDLKVAAMLEEMRNILGAQLDMNELFRSASEATRADFTYDEKESFAERYLKPMQILFDSKGNPVIQFGA